MLAAGVLTPTAAACQDNKTDELLAKSAAYTCAQFVDQFSNVVAEETLVQETTIPRRKRTMRSDFLLVRYPGERSGSRSAMSLRWTASRCATRRSG